MGGGGGSSVDRKRFCRSEGERSPTHCKLPVHCGRAKGYVQYLLLTEHKVWVMGVGLCSLLLVCVSGEGF